ncbi:MAG: bestrophin-like domain [Aliihoeflea sp.]|uniref:bestrophin-like domain n=1 Tax=Aliihoeflea sp. TaxID=2608088 RepID=UPI0040344687
MTNLGLSILVFCCLAGSALAMLFAYPRLPARHRDEATETVLRLVAGIFTLMTSLVFGLMINSARSTYDGIEADVHTFATQLIILDRSLRHYGPPGDEAREALNTYVEAAIASPARASDALHAKADPAGAALEQLGNVLAAVQPSDRYRQEVMLDIRGQYRSIVERRWEIVEQSEGSIPHEMIAMLIAWLSLVFAGFGFRAPRNAVVIGAFIASSLLLAGSFYLVLDMNVPFSGPIQVSDMPLRRALAEIGSP